MLKNAPATQSSYNLSLKPILSSLKLKTLIPLSRFYHIPPKINFFYMDPARWNLLSIVESVIPRFILFYFNKDCAEERSLVLYHGENKNLAFFVFPSHKTIMLNLCALSEMNGKLGAVKSSWYQCVSTWPVLILPPPHPVTGVVWRPPPPYLLVHSWLPI